MKWSNVEPDIKIHELQELIRFFGFTRGIFLLNTLDPFLAVCSTKCWQDIVRHLKPHNVEMGGLILGKIFQNLSLDKTVVLMENIIKSEDHKSSSVSLEMGAGIWNVANNSLDDQQAVVGWYHSHPNLGAFFSGTDRMNQKANFSSPFHIGLVYDPVREELASFRGADSLEMDTKKIMWVEN